MNLRTPESSDRNISKDVGTLWILRRSGHAVRCALVAWSSEWEVRILVDGVILLAERCPRGAGAFRLAELWKDRMIKEGWQQVVPNGRGGATVSVDIDADCGAPVWLVERMEQEFLNTRSCKD